MPMISENRTVYIPRPIPNFQNGKTIAPANKIQPMNNGQFTLFNLESPPGEKSVIPREIKTSMDDIEEIESKKKKSRRLGLWLSSLIVLIALAVIGTSLAVYFVLKQRASTASNNVDSDTTVAMTTSTTVATTTATSITTTTANCVSPYVLSSSGSCVNILIDINNCGSLGHNCSSNYTSCSAGVCSSAPSVQLTNSNFVWTAAINGSVDDNYFGVTLPFNVTLYTTTTNFVYVTTNGVLCLGSCSSAYTETALPASPFPGATALPYWDDLYIYAGTSQGIYYASEGSAPNRTLIFEFYMSHFSQPAQYYHYQVIFFEGVPGVVQYKYFDASDGGVSCTVGVQASSSGPFIQYSFDLANSVRSNMSLTFDTNLGIYTNSTF